MRLSRVRTLQLCSLLIGVLLFMGCSGGGGNGNGVPPVQPPNGEPLVSGTIQILNGPTLSPGALGKAVQPATSHPLTDGDWLVSPNQGRVTFSFIEFIAEATTERVTLSDCIVTYDRAAASLSELLTCPFEVPAGTYVGLNISFLSTFDVLIDDTTNGIYSDPEA